jgi:hypothetical protein
MLRGVLSSQNAAIQINPAPDFQKKPGFGENAEDLMRPDPFEPGFRNM